MIGDKKNSPFTAERFIVAIIDYLMLNSHPDTSLEAPEWYHEERNPENYWIREIDGDCDKGYINV